jgi:hypothetical protein
LEPARRLRGVEHWFLAFAYGSAVITWATSNALAETTIGLFKTEVIERRRPPTR